MKCSALLTAYICRTEKTCTRLGLRGLITFICHFRAIVSKIENTSTFDFLI